MPWVISQIRSRHGLLCQSVVGFEPAIICKHHSWALGQVWTIQRDHDTYCRDVIHTGQARLKGRVHTCKACESHGHVSYEFQGGPDVDTWQLWTWAIKWGTHLSFSHIWANRRWELSSWVRKVKFLILLSLSFGWWVFVWVWVEFSKNHQELFEGWEKQFEGEVWFNLVGPVQWVIV